MEGLTELQRRNEEAATKELAELRSDTVKGLRYIYQKEGMVGFLRIVNEAIGELAEVRLRPFGEAQ